MHRNNKQWKMKWGQNLLSLKYQRSLPVGFGGSKTVGRDRIVADTWHSLTVLFGSEEEGNRQGSASGHSPHRGGRARAGDVAQPKPKAWLGALRASPGHEDKPAPPRHRLRSAGPTRGKTYTNKRVILALAAPIPCPALQVKTYTNPLWDHSYD